MSAILYLPLLLAALVLPEQAVRAEIAEVLAGLRTASHPAELFTHDADVEANLDLLGDLNRPGALPGPIAGAWIGAADESWTILTPPTARRIVVRTVRWTAPEVAVVESASTLEGAMALPRSVPLLCVMRRERGAWRIASIRVQAPGRGGAR